MCAIHHKVTKSDIVQWGPGLGYFSFWHMLFLIWRTDISKNRAPWTGWYHRQCIVIPLFCCAIFLKNVYFLSITVWVSGKSMGSDFVWFRRISPRLVCVNQRVFTHTTSSMGDSDVHRFTNPKRCPVNSLCVYLPHQTMKRVSILDISTPQYPAQCLEHPSLLTQTLPTSALGSSHVLEISFLQRLFKKSFLYPSCTLSESPKNLWKLRCSSHIPEILV